MSPLRKASTFNGELYHTFDWPKQPVSFEGKRVGVIGTGSSGIQIIPTIAETAKSLTVFQRTPNFSIPVGNGPMDPAYEKEIKDAHHALRRLERNSETGIDIWLAPLNKKTTDVSEEELLAECERRWNAGGLYFMTSFTDLITDELANEKVAEFVRAKIREKVKDPVVAELLTPRGYPFGAKRLCADNGYFETFNRANVRLVDVKRAPLTGIEFTGDWIADAIEYMRRNTYGSMETTREAEYAFTRHVGEVADRTFITKADNWWVGANVPGKPRAIIAWFGGFQAFKRRVLESTTNNYAGFVFQNK